MVAKKLEKLKKGKTPSLFAEFINDLRFQIVSRLEEYETALEEEFFLDNLTQDLATIKRDLLVSINKCEDALKVGMVGQFSAGKTTTLLSLFPNPLLKYLPKDLEKASTGNVSEIRLHFGEVNNSGDLFSHCEVVLFEEDALEEMLKSYYAELCQISSFKPKLPFIEGRLIDNIEVIRDRIYDLLLEVDTKGTAPKKLWDLKDFYRLILSLWHFYIKFKDSLPVNTRPIIKLKLEGEHFHTQLKELLALNDKERSGSADEIKDLVRRQWDQVPSNFEEFQTQCESARIKSDGLRSIFLLISRVIINVIADQPTQNEKIGRIFFLDFPGLGSANARDRWLCSHEMKAAHANLLLLPADKVSMMASSDILEIIQSEKGDDANDRIFPIFSFFDRYTLIPEKAESKSDQDFEAAYKRVKYFFSQLPGERNSKGFDDLLEFLKQLQLKTREYYLLTAVAGLSDEMLENAAEKSIKRTYEIDIFPAYKDLLGDLNLCLSNSSQIEREKRRKFQDLRNALEAYVSVEQDGGVSKLREGIIQILSEQGLLMMVQDVARSLEQPMKLLEATIKYLQDEIQGVSIGREELTKRQDQIQAKKYWESLYKTYRNWSATDGRVIDLVLEAGKAKHRSNQSSILLEDLARSFILHEVLVLPFWKQAKANDYTDKQSLLSELAKQYQGLLSKQEKWISELLDEAILDTLQVLEKREITRGGSTYSILGVQKYFTDIDYSNGNLDLEEQKKIESFIDLKQEHNTIVMDLREAYEKSKEKDTVNSKLPFDEQGIILGRAVEIIKLQRQLVFTLQNRATYMLSFYNAEFNQILKRLFRQRMEIELESETIDHLADLEETGISDMSGRKKTQFLRNLANEISETWHNLIEN